MALAGILLGVVAIAVSAASVWYTREQLRLAHRQTRRDFSARVVVELIDVARNSDAFTYRLRVTNGGPAVAHDVSVDLVEWADERAGLGFSIDTQEVAALLLRGEHREVQLVLPASKARFDDRTVAYEIGADYYDDNGVRNERLALALDDGILALPSA